MADQKTPEELAAEAAAKAAKPAKVAKTEDTVDLKFIGEPYSGHLVIGVEEFVVTDGKVSVPARLIDGASHAGFR